MSCEMNMVALIPARGGSKGIPKKNIKLFAGKPLINWTIELAIKLGCFQSVIVSTDCREIEAVAVEAGAVVLRRPEHLAGDRALVKDAIRNVVEQLEGQGSRPDAVTLLECTAPMRAPEDVVACVNKVANENFDSVATFEPSRTNPHRAWKVTGEEFSPFIDGAVPWRPRQELPDAYELNGHAYTFRTELLKETGPQIVGGRFSGVVVQEDRCFGDIDTIEDFVCQETIFMMRGYHEKHS